jgi:6-phosphogluconolactonase (cycloisomerase 2 family)
VGGNVSGLNGSITLANNGGDNKVLPANGAFTFATSLTAGTAYNVTVVAKPANQQCTVTNGSGSIASNNITNVAVTCVTSTNTVGGTVSGLIGSLSLADNGGDTLVVGSNGAFTFATPLVNGSAYNVTVVSKPADQNCTVINGSGTVSGAVSTVAITCDTFRVSADIGVAGGSVIGPDGVQVIVPAGALKQSTTIGIARSSIGAPTLPIDVAAGTMYEITPHNVAFDKPVLVRLPVTSGSTTAVAEISSFGEQWESVEGRVNGAYAEWERNSFSWYHIVYLCAAPTADPHPCSRPKGWAFATATPSTAITMVSGVAETQSYIDSVNYFSSVGMGTAGSWAVDSNLLGALTLRFSHHYSAAPDCGSAHVSLKRIIPATVQTPSYTKETLFDVSVVLSADGSGSYTGVLSANQLGMNGPGTYIYKYGFYCTRPTYYYANGSPLVLSENGGSDYISFIASAGGVPGFTVGGSISGLVASGLQLQNGRREVIDVAANSSTFAFTTPLISGSNYYIGVLKNPIGQNCTVANRNGIVNANVANVAITCTGGTPPSSGTLALVANSSSNTLSIYRRDDSSGALASLGTTGTGSYPYSIAVTPDGKFAYASNLVGGNLSGFSINKTAGTLSSVGGSPGTINPYGVAMDPLGRFIWVANYSAHTVSAFAINASTGVLTSSGSTATGTYPYAAAAHPNGNFVYVVNEMGNSVSSYSVNASTGALTILTTLSNVASSPHSIVISPNGLIAYVANLTGNSVSRFTINPSTGALTLAGYTNVPGSSLGSIAVHPNGRFLYAPTSNSVQIYSIDTVSTALTVVGSPVATGSGTTAVTIDPSGASLYVLNATSKTVTSFSIDTVTGTLTQVGTTLATGNDPAAIAIVP